MLSPVTSNVMVAVGTGVIGIFHAVHTARNKTAATRASKTKRNELYLKSLTQLNYPIKQRIRPAIHAVEFGLDLVRVVI